MLIQAKVNGKSWDLESEKLNAETLQFLLVKGLALCIRNANASTKADVLGANGKAPAWDEKKRQKERLLFGVSNDKDLFEAVYAKREKEVFDAIAANDVELREYSRRETLQGYDLILHNVALQVMRQFCASKKMPMPGEKSADYAALYAKAKASPKVIAEAQRQWSEVSDLDDFDL